MYFRGLCLSLHRVNECLSQYTDMSVCLWSKNIYLKTSENKKTKNHKPTGNSLISFRATEWNTTQRFQCFPYSANILGKKKKRKKGKSVFAFCRHRAKKLLCTLFSKERELCTSIAQDGRLKTKFGWFCTHLNCLIVFFCLKILLNLTSLSSPQKWSADLSLCCQQNLCFNNSKTD